MRTLALLSGGLDSCVALASCKADGENPVAALSVIYGQKHVKEIQAAKDVALHYDLDHYIIDLGVNFAECIGKSTALINKEEALPSARRMSEMTAHVPRSYVPGRNTIFLGLAQSVAEAHDIDQICCGFNAVDYSGYPDCRPHFVLSWNNMARYATKKGYIDNRPIDVKAPIIEMSKASVVDLGLRLGAPLHLTWSCYRGSELPCGTCDSCIIRANAFWAIGKEDPVGPYQVTPYKSF